MPQAWIMRTTTVASAGSSPSRFGLAADHRERAAVDLGCRRARSRSRRGRSARRCSARRRAADRSGARSPTSARSATSRRARAARRVAAARTSSSALEHAPMPEQAERPVQPELGARPRSPRARVRLRAPAASARGTSRSVSVRQGERRTSPSPRAASERSESIESGSRRASGGSTVTATRPSFCVASPGSQPGGAARRGGEVAAGAAAEQRRDRGGAAADVRDAPDALVRARRELEEGASRGAERPRRHRRGRARCWSGCPPARARTGHRRSRPRRCSATSAPRAEGQSAAVVDREQEAPRERRQPRVVAQAAVELRRRSHPSRRAPRRAGRPAGSRARCARARARPTAAAPASSSSSATALARRRRESADLQVRARGELDDAVAESRGRGDRLELARSDAAAGQAHARQPAVLRRVQRDHAGAVICPGVSRVLLRVELLARSPSRPLRCSVGRGRRRAGAAAPRDDRLTGHDALRGAGEDEADRRPEHELHADRRLAEAEERDRRERLRHFLDGRQQARRPR